MLKSYKMKFVDFSQPDPPVEKDQWDYYEIWVGHYHLGQGYDPPTSPQRIGAVYAPSFKQACYIYELERSLRTAKSTKLGNRDYVSSYDPHKMYNSWTGYYYPSKEEALKSFKR